MTNMYNYFMNNQSIIIIIIIMFARLCVGRNSVVGVATRYGLVDPEIESRWGEIFRYRPGRPWDPSSLLYHGYWAFPGGKAARA
jgi:hypothetical protein